MINGWMDAPSRKLGTTHRIKRHDINTTPLEACEIYGDGKTQPTSKNLLIVRMVLQHLKLDGLITPSQEKNWTWEQAIRNQKTEVVTTQFFDYLLPSKKVIRSNDNVKFRNIIIYDTEEETEYWIGVINHFVSRANKQYRGVNVNARISEDGDLEALMEYCLKPTLVNILVWDKAFSRRVKGDTLREFFELKDRYKTSFNRKYGYILSFVILHRFFLSIPQALRTASDGLLVRSASLYDREVISRLAGKKALHILERLSRIKNENPELKDLDIFVGRDFSGLVSLPLCRKKNYLRPAFSLYKLMQDLGLHRK